MSISGDWRERHGQKQSGNRVIVYIVLLIIIFLLIAKAGDFSKQFTQIFFQSSDSTMVESPENSAEHDTNE